MRLLLPGFLLPGMDQTKAGAPSGTPFLRDAVHGELVVTPELGCEINRGNAAAKRNC